MNAPHEQLAHRETPSFVAEIIGRCYSSTPGEIFEEPLHVIALQECQPSYSCQGRYRLPKLGQDFNNIGRLLVLPASTPLEVLTADRPDRVVRCMFSHRTLEEYGAGQQVYDASVLSSFLNLNHRGIFDVLTLLGNELRSPGFASDAMTEALGTTLLIQFARYVKEHPKGPVIHRGGLSRRHLRMITEVVEGETRCPSLTDLSEIAGLSLRHLTRSFKQTTGMTIYSYIEQVRLRKAQALLADTDHMVKDIAFQLGFSCASSFSVAFRKLAGESPQQYRNRVGRTRQKPPAARSSH